MERQICWKDKNDQGEKRDTRVRIFGGKIKWQFKTTSMDRWDYDTPPTVEQWDDLIRKLEGRYNRKRCSLRDLELAQKERQRLYGKS
ncbi:MAG: hypothetical protein AAF984_11305 [Verrucomicrobiota bacterium]